MNPRSFLVLLGVTAAFTFAAGAVIVSKDTGTGVRGEGRIMFPGLVTKVNDVRRVKVTRGTGTATLVGTTKDGKVSWTLKELYGYRVPLVSVRAVAAGLAQIAAIEAKTTRPAKYPKIRVEDPKGKKSKSARVELFDAKGEKLADIIVGMEKASFTGPGQLYVRRPGDERAWLARGKVRVPEKLTNWVDQMIVEADLPRLRESTLFIKGEKPLRVFKKKESDQDFVVEGMGENYEVKELFGAEDISRSIQNLGFEEVRPNKEIGIDLKQAPHIRHITFDGLIVEGWSKTVGKKHWFTFRARANPAPLAGENVDKAKIAKEVVKINRVNTDWAYTISDFETKNMFQTRATLIQLKPGAKPAPPKSDPAKSGPAKPDAGK
ncbi:MAG: DUF4340 domain-containing protein [Alphaproteobacteria bacterium]|nr:DUF4340 domain-containing protein [Alphaproteobacteria bacterium]